MRIITEPAAELAKARGAREDHQDRMFDGTGCLTGPGFDKGNAVFLYSF
jgi:hypothetical protein